MPEKHILRRPDSKNTRQSLTSPHLAATKPLQAFPDSVAPDGLEYRKDTSRAVQGQIAQRSAKQNIQTSVEKLMCVKSSGTSGNPTVSLSQHTKAVQAGTLRTIVASLMRPVSLTPTLKHINPKYYLLVICEC